MPLRPAEPSLAGWPATANSNTRGHWARFQPGETKQAHRDSDELSLRCEIWQREWLGLRLLFRLPRRNSQLLQLGIAHRGRRIHHQINGTSGLWEGNYFAQAVGAGEDHHNAIEPKRNAAVRWRAVFERFQKESEAGAGFFVAHAERLKDFALNILAMNTDRARPKLGSIQHNVVRQRANFAQRRLGVVHGINIGLELRHVFFVERCEGMVRRIPALLDIVPLEHREI